MSNFETLNGINVNGKTEKKKSGGTELTYLSWPWAWAEVKKRFEDASYTIWKDDQNRPYVFDPELGYMVYTTVTIGGITHEMWLPVMDGANKAMKNVPYKYMTKYNGEKTCEAATMMDINKTIMRCLVKNLAMFGLGLYIYAGEDLPEGETDKKDEQPKEPEKKTTEKPVKKDPPADVDKTKKLPKANPVQAYLNNEIAFMAQRLEISDKAEMGKKFVEMRSALVNGGVIEDISSEKLTMEQAHQMIDAMYATFFTDGGAA